MVTSSQEGGSEDEEEEQEEDASAEGGDSQASGKPKKAGDKGSQANDVTRISFENENEETKIDIEGGKGSKSSSG